METLLRVFACQLMFARHPSGLLYTPLKRAPSSESAQHSAYLGLTSNQVKAHVVRRGAVCVHGLTEYLSLCRAEAQEKPRSQP